MSGRYGQFMSSSLEYPEPSGMIPQGPDQVVVRDAVKPGSEVLGEAFRAP
jgi:hypothetical protein